MGAIISKGAKGGGAIAFFISLKGAIRKKNLGNPGVKYSNFNNFT